MMETRENVYEQMQNLMSRLALAGLAITGLVLVLIASLGAG
jgi:hypothetical protein